MAKLKLIVMDYSVGEVHIFDLNADPTEENIAEFLEDYHNNQGGSFKLSQIDWMAVNMASSENRLPLYIH